jgi:hypothetical protein
VGDKMDFSVFVPSSRQTIWVCQHQFFASNLSKHLRFVILLHGVLLMVVLITIDSPNKVRPAIVFAETSSSPHLIYTYKLLVELTSSIMKSRRRCRNRNEHIVVIADVFLESIQKVVAEKVASVRSEALVAMNKHNRVVISPLLFGGMSIPSIHDVEQLLFVNLHHHLIDEVGHQNQHYNIPIFLEDAVSTRFIVE